MSPEEFLKIVQKSYESNLDTRYERTWREQLDFTYEMRWYDWNVVATYIAHPEASLALIAEAWRFAPDFVERQPRWAELAQHPDWNAAVAQPQRALPVSERSGWGSLPAYYVQHLIEKKDIKTLCIILESHMTDKEFFDRWSTGLLAFEHQSIDLRIMELHQVDWKWMRTMLEKFAKSKYATVRMAVARHVHVSPETLRLLCTDPDEKVAKAAVAHKLFPDDALDLVAQHEEERQGARLDKLDTLGWKELGDFLTSPDFPTEGLDILAERDDAAIQFACAMHPNASEAVWRKSLGEAEDWKKAAVALNPNVPHEVMHELAAIDSVDIAFALAGSPQLPEALQLKLATHPDRMVRLHLADHTSSHAVWSLIAAQPGREDVHTTFEQLLAIAIDPKSPASKVGNLQAPTNTKRSNGEALATCIGHAIAMHPKVPEKLLGKLRYFLPELLADNPGVHLRMLEGLPMPDPEPIPEWKMNSAEIVKYPGYAANGLLRSGDLTVQRMACVHIGCDKSLLMPLWLVPDTVLLKKIAQRTDLPRFFYEMLWQHSGDPVRAVLKENKAAKQRGASFTGAAPAPVAGPRVASAAPAPVIGKGGVKGNKKERIELAKTSTDEAILIALASDKLSEVRSALTAQEALPWPVIVLLARDAEQSIRRHAPAYLASFPVEQTVDIESALLAEGGEVADHLARHTKNHALQSQMVGKHDGRLVYNDFLAPAIADHYLHHGSIDALFDVLGNLETQPAFSVKAVQFLSQVLDNHANDPLAALKVLYAAPDEEQRQRHQARVAVFMKDSRRRMEHYRYYLMGPTEKFLDDAGMQSLLLQWLAPDYAYAENRAWAARICTIMTGEVIARLLKGNVEDRTALAANPSLPDAAADILKADKEVEVRVELAGWNARLGAHFVNDQAYEVRAALALVTRETALQRQLLTDKAEQVRAALAQNPECATDILTELVNKNVNYDVRRYAVENPAVSLESLKVMLKDRSGSVRATAAKVIESREATVS